MKRPAVVKEPAPAVREPRVTAVTRKSRPVPLGLLLGIGGGLVGLLLLIVVAIVVALLLHRSGPVPLAGPSQLVTEVAQGGGEPGAVPEAPPAAAGGEEFVDLPERGADMPGIAGLNPDPPDAGPPPAVAGGDLRVNLTGGRVTRVTRRVGRITQSGTIVQVQYRFERGVPTRTQSFGMVIAPARGNALKITFAPGALHEQGTVTSSALPTGAGGFDGPYRVFLILATLGRPDEAETISNELTIR